MVTTLWAVTGTSPVVAGAVALAGAAAEAGMTVTPGVTRGGLSAVVEAEAELDGGWRQRAPGPNRSTGRARWRRHRHRAVTDGAVPAMPTPTRSWR
jgi:hypothetical protein